MFVQQPKQVDDRRQRDDFAAFVAGKRVAAVAGEAGGGNLTEAGFRRMR